ncbi:hypothetical protein SDC9_194072 [bioreactor metagenome]|uniref:ADP-ribose pyrophosphatase n=1 Tax=bioreactor metagenome TaxID=1076179 RepID=A0A645I6G2_9ZZZZ
MYMAEGLSFGKSHTDEDEFLTLEKVPINQLTDKILSGEIKDGKTQAAVLKVYAMRQRQTRKV